MNRVSYSPAAVADINDIWDCTAENWGVDQADRYTDRIRDSCNGPADGKRIGSLVDIRDGYLKYAVGRHFGFFVKDGDGIAVIRVLHQSMDVEKHLRLHFR